MRARRLFAGAAILLTALNLRPAVTSLGALLPDVQGAIGMSATTAGVLTTLPPVCFGVFGLLAARFARRAGTATTVSIAMVVVALSLLGRVLTGLPLVLLALTVPALGGMAVGNVLLPVAVKRWFPTRIGRLTGMYSLGLAVGTAAAAGLAVPAAEAAGTWRVGLGLWALPALLAAVPWWWLRRLDAPPPPAAVPPGPDPAETVEPEVITPASGTPVRVVPSPVHRSPQAWALAGFFGLQSLAAYTVMGWLPSIYQDAGLSATAGGLLLALTMGVGAPVSIVLPELAARRPDQRPWVVGLALLAASGHLGLLLAPARVPVLWALLVGVGLGAFPLALVLIGLRAGTNEGTARLSSLSQGVGYLIAASGPLLIGLLHGRTGSWTLPLVALLVLLVPQVLCGLAAARPGYVDLTVVASAGEETR